MSNLPALVEGAKTTALTTIESARENASRYALASKADASKRAYASDWRAFASWCFERDLVAMPAAVETVVSYLADMANQSLATSTIRRKAAALGYFHKLKGYSSPTTDPLARAVLSGIARTHGSAVTRKSPVTDAVVRKMLGFIPATTIGLRDRALLLVGFAGALRRSELVALTTEDLERSDRGLLIHVRRSKTDQEGIGRTIAIPHGGKLKVIEALDTWLAAGRIQGAIFRNIRKGGIVGEQLTDRSVSLIVKRYAEKAGLDPALFAGHSLRAGFVTTAFDHGSDAFRIADVTGHRELRTLKVYDRRQKFDKHAGRNFL